MEMRAGKQVDFQMTSLFSIVNLFFDICVCRQCSRMVPSTCTSTSLKVDFTQTPNARGSIAGWQRFMQREVSTCWKT